ncbi:MAG: pyridoxal-phosphate dependent enzyme [Ardenticatenaceae bacterium]|nr:pyridoxal-phosphate dependent enzyme [Ardenticatenaceae bacterium]MCB9445490.1 pyridoxal-phosphate dependent enzyme [Ardenticatenaceae bacterium]
MTPSYPINGRVRGLNCIRCGQHYETDSDVADQGIGCPACLEQGYPASLQIDYAASPTWQIQPDSTCMKRYAAHLPYLDFPSLGEGMTPLIALTSLAQSLGIEKLWLKNEGQNPTGSHKDRMSALAVARAAALGRTAVVATSSGNAGASLAAYAAAAGMRCVIIATTQISPIWAQAIKLTGAELVLTLTPLERWQVMQRMVEQEQWYPVTNYINPPVGSNPFGVQGYKTIAYEIMEQCNPTPPTMIIIPASRGDLLWGIGQGLLEMEQGGVLPKRPRLAAVEPVARLSRVLAGGDYRQLFLEEAHAMTSIGGETVTYQSAATLREWQGLAVEVTTESARAAQKSLAHSGFYVELSSAATLAGLQTLQQRGEIDGSERIVLIATSHGYKEPPPDNA